MPFGSSVCVVSVMRSGSYDDLYPVQRLRQNKMEYCKLCGYRCFLLKDHYASRRSAGWDKLLAMKDALRKKCKLALWLDSDVVVLHPVQLLPLAKTPISATKDYYGFNTGVMLMTRSKAVERLLQTAWEQTAFVPNRLGAEQSAIRYVLHSDLGLRDETTIYGNLVRYPVQLALTARLKWNKTLRLRAPLFHAAGCSMSQKSRTCSEWLNLQLDYAQKNWQALPNLGGKCQAFDDELSLPRPLKVSDMYIPFGQGRDVILKTQDAARLEQVALRKIERKACHFAQRRDMCARENETASPSSVLVSTALGVASSVAPAPSGSKQIARTARPTTASVREWATAANLDGILNGQLLKRLELLGDNIADLAYVTDADWEQTLGALRLKLGQQRRVQAAIRALRQTVGLPIAAHARRLQNDEPSQRPVAAARRPHFAILTFVSDGKSYDRDRDPIALMSCFAREHGVPYYIESHDYGAHWYNKHYALRKYLPHFEWLLYVDSDTYIIDRTRGYHSLLNMTAMLDAGGYHVAISELHHSGAGGFDAGAMLIKGSDTGLRLVEEWSKGEEREYRNADNGFLHILFLRWILGSAYDGHCDHHLYKYMVKSLNGTMVQAKEYTPPTIRAYNGFFPCFYHALGLPNGVMRMRKLTMDDSDDRQAWKPFYVMYWDEPGVLSCAYPRRSTPQMTAAPISCRQPLIYHAKDIHKRFWRGVSGCDHSTR